MTDACRAAAAAERRNRHSSQSIYRRVVASRAHAVFVLPNTSSRRVSFSLSLSLSLSLCVCVCVCVQRSSESDWLVYTIIVSLARESTAGRTQVYIGECFKAALPSVLPRHITASSPLNMLDSYQRLICRVDWISLATEKNVGLHHRSSEQSIYLPRLITQICPANLPCIKDLYQARDKHNASKISL